MIVSGLDLGTYREENLLRRKHARAATAGGCRQLTHRVHETLQDGDMRDGDFRNLVRVISACTLGLWAFAAGLLIGTFLFS
ncbi:hypothetical protein JQ633_10510 [Bradyrhizobium tropiciagri]|uniref:hypothetical protein n=1 Tax=Bradyrhizobium tropiciagri TaxID=312253 RepID=UPI001BA71FEE|nr:hypothetical protein [Bradyrhizobium tropiciagri]MBR0870792.1 hypothetical protein [Bradyrhizobium tropiciagri]